MTGFKYVMDEYNCSGKTIQVYCAMILLKTYSLYKFYLLTKHMPTAYISALLLLLLLLLLKNVKIQVTPSQPLRDHFAKFTNKMLHDFCLNDSIVSVSRKRCQISVSQMTDGKDGI